MSAVEDRVVIGMDPHKRSVTIEVMAGDETILGGGRFGTDRDGFEQMLACAKAWPNRVWAIEGCSGIGRHVAVRLLGGGDEVVDNDLADRSPRPLQNGEVMNLGGKGRLRRVFRPIC